MINNNVTQKKSGHAALKIWNSNYKHGHLPVWFTKELRSRLKDDCTPEHLIHMLDLFDHWGSIPSPDGGKNRWVYTMPYGDQAKQAAEFTARFGFQMVASAVGPWHPRASCYLFAPEVNRPQ